MNQPDSSENYSQGDLFAEMEPEAAGYALRWRKMFVASCPQTMASHLQNASGSYSTAALVRSDGGFSTASTLESPNDAVVCSLSAILEDNPATKYSLSPKACRGILRRAEKRGKDLPPMLEEALRQVAGPRETEEPTPKSAAP